MVTTRMGDLMRVDDMVTTLKGYHPTRYYICKIVNIIDEDGKSYSEYNVITGHGDINSKITYDLKVIALETHGLIGLEPIDNFIIYNKLPRDVYNHDPYKHIEQSNIAINLHQKNILFYEKNKNKIDLRREKLEKLLE